MQRDSRVPEVFRGHLDTIGEAGQRLLSLINDVLEVTRIEAGQTTIANEALDLFSMLESVEEMICPCAREKGLWFGF